MAQILETALLNQINFQTSDRDESRAGARKRPQRHGAGVRSAPRPRRRRKRRDPRRPDRRRGLQFERRHVGGDGLAAQGHARAQHGTGGESPLACPRLDAFRAYAEAYPDDTLLLVDTIDTLGSGIPNAIKVFEELRRKGHEPVGVRLDSGDLAYLTMHAAKMLDEAGFPDTSIVLSNNLDELVIWQIGSQIRQDAPREGLDAEGHHSTTGLWRRHAAGHLLRRPVAWRRL